MFLNFLYVDAPPPPPPPRPKMPFTHVVNVYSDMSLSKGHLGSGGGGGGKHKQTERHQFHLSNDKRRTFRCISYACAGGIRLGLGNEEHSYP